MPKRNITPPSTTMLGPKSAMTGARRSGSPGGAVAGPEPVVERRVDVADVACRPGLPPAPVHASGIERSRRCRHAAGRPSANQITSATKGSTAVSQADRYTRAPIRRHGDCRPAQRQVQARISCRTSSSPNVEAGQAGAPAERSVDPRPQFAREVTVVQHPLHCEELARAVHAFVRCACIPRSSSKSRPGAPCPPTRHCPIRS